MTRHRVRLRCPDATGQLVRVEALPAIDGTVMVLAPRGGFRLTAAQLREIEQALPGTEPRQSDVDSEGSR